ncbi:hypothetical protein KIN20_021871 [Parelaphostrongylus tenuis]|uniref:Uncharacterized protein n=1 Tax=Parelaphostrongylus tenuis TaxID=148309 RepID=A0AAD5MT93_PARTN|nr:hypothetical protein KIN20_021871 [Parelaphostrongylus tenuis]
MEDDEKRYEAEPSMPMESPVHEVIPEENPVLAETWEIIEKEHEEELPKTAGSPAREASLEGRSLVRESVLTTELYETPECMQYAEKRYEAESPMLAESPLPEVPLEKYPAVAETVIAPGLYEERPKHMEFVQRKYEPEPPMLTEGPDREVQLSKPAESPVHEVIQEENPILTETWEIIEKGFEEEPPKTAESLDHEVLSEERSIVTQSVITTELYEGPEHMKYVEKRYEVESPCLLKAYPQDFPQFHKMIMQ